MKFTEENSFIDKPIGIYDSGVGGLSVLHELSRLLPNEDFIYYGDLKNSPYGTKSESEIMKLSLSCGEFLYNKSVKSIVIACNTATSIVVQNMRDKYNIPIFSMEPAVKPATEQYKDGVILVLATPATLAQKRYSALLTRLGAEDRVKNVACTGLVELIENGLASSAEMDDYLRRLLEPISTKENICAIVLGCTHYSFAQPAIEKAAELYLNGECKIFDGRFGTARYVRDTITNENLLNDPKNMGKIKFFSSLNKEEDSYLKKFYYNNPLSEEK